MRRAGALLLTGLLSVAAVAGCSKGDDSDATSNGISITGKDGKGGTGTTTSLAKPTVTFSGDAGSAFCTKLRGLDTDQALKGDETPEATKASYQGLLALLRDVDAIAPKELASDIHGVLEGVQVVDEALQSVGYDTTRLDQAPNALEVSATLNDPAFATSSARITAYKTQVCKL